jgi:hypothetical protein
MQANSPGLPFCRQTHRTTRIAPATDRTRVLSIKNRSGHGAITCRKRNTCDRPPLPKPTLLFVFPIVAFPCRFSVTNFNVSCS